METSGDIVKATEFKREEERSWTRETWKREADFLIALIGGCVGLGNFWRFPYLCYKNGGGAFLIPYFMSVILCGFPLYYLEMAVGQYMGKGGSMAWNIVPLFQGIGFASLTIIFFLSCYYNVILAWILYYLCGSFTSELPWEKCGHDWNSPNCSEDIFSSINSTTRSTGMTTDPVNEFWENKVLHISNSLDNLGDVKWDLALCLLLAWIIVYLSLCKGIKSSGKVMYVTATTPYILMFILLIRNCTLDGSVEGIRYYLQVDISKLSDSSVWVDAGTQVFFSWALCCGAVTVYGSYNKFHYNSLSRDAAALSVVNMSTSFLAGFIVFSILGSIAQTRGIHISDVAESGPGLAFIAYPKAVVQLPVSPLWSVLFFITMILLGLDSQFLNVEAVVTCVVDQYPHILRKGYRKELFVGIICMVMFLIGLTMVTEGGIYIFQMFDYFIGSRIIMIIAMSEIIAVSYCYGARRFVDNIKMMIGNTSVTRLLPYLRFTWTYTAPVFSVAILVMIIYNHSDLTYKRPNRPKYFYPDWSLAIGWSMAVFTIIWIPLVALIKVIRLFWTSGRLRREDLRLLVVPYSLAEHQKRREDKNERCLKEFEEMHNKGYGQSIYQGKSQEDLHMIDQSSLAHQTFI